MTNTHSNRKRRILVWVLLGLVALLLLGAGGFFVWANQVSAPMPEALAALQSDEQVQFSVQNGWLVFQPTLPNGEVPKTGLVLYPGGRVDPWAYAPAARAIAEAGYLVVIVPVRLNLALLDSAAAQPVMDAFPEVEHWVVGGHSLGGAAAALFASGHSDVDGLVLWASYPPGDMTAWQGQVLSVSGTQDGLATPAKIQDSRKLEPADTQFVMIDGGNHAQFGYYGDQAGDNPATITREEQQAQVVASTAQFLQALNGGAAQ